ncbi:proprotein convertase P-domain-containing protein [Vibrio metschnikovii]
MTDRDLIIDKRFTVYLDIEHPSMSDLSITLTSPQGTKVTLWDHQSSLQSGFNGYFTVEHDQPLASLEQQMGWGRWRLEIIDQHEGHQGTLRAWGVGPFSDYQCSHNEQPSLTSPSSGGSSNGLSLLILLSIFMARIISSRSTYLEPTKEEKMKYQYSFIAAALLLAGCGGSDSPESPVELPQYQLSGKLDINTQTLLNAKVCTDLNHNLRCDATEPSIEIQSDKPFSLQATTEKLYSSLVSC